MPVTYDNLSRGNSWAIKWGPFEQGDISDGNRVREVILKYRPAALMHFAAYAYVGESVEQPLLCYQSNFGGSLALFGAMLAVKAYPGGGLLELRELRQS